MIPYPARSILFVPANRKDLAQKAAASAANVVCLDLEDGVHPDEKGPARGNLADMAGTVAGSGKPVWLRVNSEIELMTDDVRAMPATVRAIVLSKARDLTHVALTGDMIERLNPQGEIAVVALVEDPAGVHAFGNPPGAGHPGRLAALALGVEDLATTLSANPSSGVIAAQFHALIAAAHRLGVSCIGYPGPIANFRDIAAFRETVDAAASCGASGGFCIHPAQIAPLNEAFGTSPEALASAEQIVRAFEQDTAGKGVVVVNGRMVDRPIYLRAKTLLAR